ncbi:hypothetical protein [Haloarchaeobius amylolyticus]|uniref:hypothetical protein n=1 Tax=Haloarchaeobius amylolyticus TaxID=1198296 RepID=UPI00226D65FE|nr:hypothetical protein [Haloarchaeobius amylolyticus]
MDEPSTTATELQAKTNVSEPRDPDVTVTVEVLRTGSVSIDRALAYEEATRHPMPETGWFRPADARRWVPVSAYLLTHPEGTVLVDTGGTETSGPTAVAISGSSSRRSTKPTSRLERLLTNNSRPMASSRPIWPSSSSRTSTRTTSAGSPTLPTPRGSW